MKVQLINSVEYFKQNHFFITCTKDDSDKLHKQNINQYVYVKTMYSAHNISKTIT